LHQGRQEESTNNIIMTPTPSVTASYLWIVLKSLIIVVFFLEIKKGNDDLDTCVWWLMSSSPKLFFAEFIFWTNNIKISKTRERIPQGCEMMARKRNMSIHNGPSAAQAIGLPFCQGRQRQNLLFGSSS